MLKVTRAPNGEVVFRLSGRMDAENLSELQMLLSKEVSDRKIVLDLRDLTLVDQDAVTFLQRCELDGIQLENCPAYIREWINGERAMTSRIAESSEGPNRVNGIPDTKSTEEVEP